MKKYAISLLSIVLFTGCAAIYHPIRPAEIGYGAPEISEKLSYSLKFDPLLNAGNPRFARKEAKYGISIVAVKITNNTDHDLTVGNEIGFFPDNREVIPLEPRSAGTQLGLGTAGYLLYSLLFLYIKNNNDVTTIPIGLPIGLGNLIVGTNSNNKLTQELITQSILSKKIGPNETIYGLVAFRDIRYGKLTLKAE